MVFKSILASLAVVLVFFSGTGQASPNDSYTLRVLTLNTWLLPSWLSHFSGELGVATVQRLQLIPNALAVSGADIIGLQEVWKQTPFDDSIRQYLVKEMSRRGYWYAYKNNASWGEEGKLKGLFGNGLLIFSKFPIDSKFDQYVFSQNTVFDERFAAKGVLHVQIKLPIIGNIDFYDSHFGSVEFHSPKRTYDSKEREIRLLQVRQFAQFVQATSHKGQVQMATIDLNTHPLELDAATGEHIRSTWTPEYNVFTQTLNWIDTFHDFNPAEALESAYTYDGRTNPFAAMGVFKNTPPEYLDYIFTNANPYLKVVKSQLVFLTPILPAKVFLSDHFGVMTTFEVAGGAAHASARRASR